MKHSMATEGLSSDSFPSPRPPATSSPAPAAEAPASCGGGGDEQCGGGPRDCVVVVDDAGEFVSCARRGEARPHGLGGTGGFRWGPEAAPAAAPAEAAVRRWSGGRFVAGDGDLRVGRSPGSRRGGGGGEGDARPPPGRPAP
ncbi:Os05g0503200 [Oryza sativa Japonica Group]|uniref:Os05g0503200 protein n=1 Tax=Oryza sativa subsp. japonica TaxID=39947 RepID=A0A0P0WPE4_ORYSJ|nr:Os05g0503200 [Oryza sativa Japonica Group]